MWIVVTTLLLATLALGHYLDIFPDEPENMVITNTFHVERQTHYLECPPRAVCGVAFDFNRTRRGQQIPERRIIHHCRCPSTEDEDEDDPYHCPIDPAHRVFASIRKREYLCQPVSQLRPCDLLTPIRTRQPAKELVEGSEDYDFYNYNRINCMCPRHMNPQRPKRRRGMALATRMYRVRFDFGRHMQFHLRHCIIDNTTQEIIQQH